MISCSTPFRSLMSTTHGNDNENGERRERRNGTKGLSWMILYRWIYLSLSSRLDAYERDRVRERVLLMQ